MQRSPRQRNPSSKVIDVNNAANPLSQKDKSAKSGAVKGLVQAAKKVGGKLLPKALSPRRQTQPQDVRPQPRVPSKKSQSQPVAAPTNAAPTNLQQLTKEQNAEKNRKRKLAQDEVRRASEAMQAADGFTDDDQALPNKKSGTVNRKAAADEDDDDDGSEEFHTPPRPRKRVKTRAPTPSQSDEDDEEDEDEEEGNPDELTHLFARRTIRDYDEGDAEEEDDDPEANNEDPSDDLPRHGDDDDQGGAGVTSNGITFRTPTPSPSKGRRGANPSTPLSLRSRIQKRVRDVRAYKAHGSPRRSPRSPRSGGSPRKGGRNQRKYKITSEMFSPPTSRLVNAGKTIHRRRTALLNAYPGPLPDDRDDFAWVSLKEASAHNQIFNAAFLRAEKDDVQKKMLIQYVLYGRGSLLNKLMERAKAELSGQFGIPGTKDSGEVEAIVAWLLDRGRFKYGGMNVSKRTFDKNKPFGADFIRSIIAAQFFPNNRARADAASFQALIKMRTIPGQLTALVCTAMEHALSQYSDGTHRNRDFTDASRNRYIRHLVSWEALAEKAPAWARRHQAALFTLIMHQSNKAFILDGPADMPDVDADALEEEAMAAEEAEELADQAAEQEREELAAHDDEEES